MVKRAIHPYSFRARLLLGLLISSILAGVIALALSFVFSHMNLESEVEERERTIALYMLELDQKTDLSIDELLRIARQDNLSVTQVSDADRLDSATVRSLSSISVSTLMWLKIRDSTAAMMHDRIAEISSPSSSRARKE